MLSLAFPAKVAAFFGLPLLGQSVKALDRVVTHDLLSFYLLLRSELFEFVLSVSRFGTTFCVNHFPSLSYLFQRVVVEASTLVRRAASVLQRHAKELSPLDAAAPTARALAYR